MKTLVLTLCSLLLVSCAMTPKNISVVKGFELERYLGTWYEIARLDHRFERGLSRVSAEYSMRTDGGVDVLNQGFNQKTEAWKEAKGRAYPIGNPGDGSLKVTFFWPFYAGYNIIELEQINYSYALVSGPNRKYLWILSRQKKLEEEVVSRLVAKAKELGFQTDDLIFVEHGS